jgi:hypothetical protein
MTTPKLILVEGIPGSGKTTTARFVCDWLEQQGKQPLLFQEGDWNHPADFEGVACLTESEYCQLKAEFPAHAGHLAQYARLENEEWFFSYRKMQQEQGEQLPDALITALSRFEIYELPAEKFKRLLLQRWQNFADGAAASEIIYVFECCFLQNPITTLFAQHNLAEDIIRPFVFSLAESLQPLQPLLVYLVPTDVRATLEKIRLERPREWADFVAWYLTGKEYGRDHGLSGFEGVIEFYTMRQRFELQLLDTLPVSSIVLGEAGSGWEGRYKELSAFLESRLK